MGCHIGVASNQPEAKGSRNDSLPRYWGNLTVGLWGGGESR